MLGSHMHHAAAEKADAGSKEQGADSVTPAEPGWRDRAGWGASGRLCQTPTPQTEAASSPSARPRKEREGDADGRG